jgi:GT2 family glycosyltransferase
MINVFILNWKSARQVERCLTGVCQSTSTDFRILLIDNFSSLEEAERICAIRDKFKDKAEIHFVGNDSNLGYSGGNNKGYEFLKQHGLGGDILILNPDVSLEPDTLGKMAAALREEVGIVSVRTKDRDGRILYDAIRMVGLHQRRIVTDKDEIDTDYSQGSCILVKRGMVDRIGLFDERFFLYFEEVDLSLRVKKLNQRLLSITTTSIVREKNADSCQPLAYYYCARNGRLMRQKYPGTFTLANYFYFVFRLCASSLKYVCHFRVFLSIWCNIMCGIRHSMLNNYGPKPA